MTKAILWEAPCGAAASHSLRYPLPKMQQPCADSGWKSNVLKWKMTPWIIPLDLKGWSKNVRLHQGIGVAISWIVLQESRLPACTLRSQPSPVLRRRRRSNPKASAFLSPPWAERPDPWEGFHWYYRDTCLLLQKLQVRSEETHWVRRDLEGGGGGTMRLDLSSSCSLDGCKMSCTAEINLC